MVVLIDKNTKYRQVKKYSVYTFSCGCRSASIAQVSGTPDSDVLVTLDVVRFDENMKW